MITVEDRGDELYVVDAEKNELTVRVEGWEPGGEPCKIDRRVDKTIAGKVSEIRFPPSGLSIETEDEDQWTFSGNEIGAHELGCKKHLVQINGNIITFIQATGPATIRRIDRGDSVIVSFDGQTQVTMGFRAGFQLPIGKITVPPTPVGIGAGISMMSAAINTTNPDKSFPSLREHPPLIEFGEEYNIAKKIRENSAETGIRVHLPNNLAAVLVASPLAYYLQASIEVDRNVESYLTIPSIGVKRSLDSLPDLQDDIANLLHRCFYLDCLVRNAGPYSNNLAKSTLLDYIDLDGSTLYNATPAERLAIYLDAPYSNIKAEFPDWHLSTFVEPEVSYATGLPHLLDRLSLIFLPDASELNKKELIEHSLGETYQSQRFTGQAQPGTNVNH